MAIKKKLKRILLIDDSEADNFFHARVIRKYGCAEEIIIREGGQEALDYLRLAVDGIFPQPDLIFLDINMPGMNGWEFLEEYENLEIGQKARIVIVMLTTSLNPNDSEEAKKRGTLNKFMNKPLTEKMLEDVIKEHFKECFED